jgi:hypothetical protein
MAASIETARLRPVTRADLMRVGPPRDGGYVVPGDLVRASEHLLALGIGDDWQFEAEFARVNPRVRILGVDGSIGMGRFAREWGSSLLALFSVGLSVKDRRRHWTRLRRAAHYFWFFGWRHHHIRRMVAPDATPATVTIASLLGSLGSKRPYGVFLKVDVEGAEYGLIDTITAHADAIGCLVIEFHRTSRHAAAFNTAMDRLLRHFRVVHVHGNNYAPCDPASGFPEAVEITLVHERLCGGPPVPIDAEYPRAGLDYPNHPGRPDHAITFA